MKTGRSLQDFAVELDRRDKAKRDFVVPAKQMYLTGETLELTVRDSEYAETGWRYEPTALCHRQLGDVYGIPAKYYDRMQTGAPRLLADNVNHWLLNSDKRHTVRTLDGTARAFLSDRYRRIDNYEIARTVLPLISEMPDARVESCEVTENRMYLKVVNPRLEAEVTKGDVVQAGIVISNSEVGLGSVSVMPLVYRLVCTNGMIINDAGQRKYHVGRQNDSDWELFSDETLALDDRAFMAKLADIVRTAVDAARFAVVVDKLREAAAAKFTAPVTDVVELTSNRYGFTKNESDGILQHLIEGGDLSLWGLGNAVTRTAADVDSYDRSTALESAGWQVTAMEPRLWQELNEVRV
jgi:hypothetical protein